MSIKMGWSHLMESSGNMLESASNELFNGRRMQLDVNSGWRSFHALTSRKRWPFNLYFCLQIPFTLLSFRLRVIHSFIDEHTLIDYCRLFFVLPREDMNISVSIHLTTSFSSSKKRIVTGGQNFVLIVLLNRGARVLRP
ncbi:hypothetical protein C343_00958 [Cryptococcus neoformans C23]|uniref:Uncharacterized protein n=2 Tax=Cryptococcus neoformans TaxID=5207 RepID=A0A854QKT7_CRYNE|nr:hypothetical protein CNAG_07963 [Cryptococcus neoformans var. grubii H99]AUB22569.1 hypothetical protein CKF44_07963 [Cryptococcus neoformans var. grubii]OWZ35685.1 hypothetical protein C347_01030 [Cryptococcus neoformans var. grubii AD2-60a]OWZ47603.1 hypothetical protein C343_00958 [Cryptococcus neoformans var. grubii C23]OWZ53497.1 hypothetical protein C353_00964 [Cryptococcus neoformans var. grubii AD1-83a]OWZ57299.1 hypothetical protein C368_01467 [Cryptococcus neoformans var. grubii 1|eukprot:XP_012047768.1 hypothetical protein CNAG_07963 [Cryptococcus neoformans var. grubii H99]